MISQNDLKIKLYLSARDTKILFTILLLTLSMVGCHDDTEETLREQPPARRTLVMFMPWSTNMKDYFEANVAGMEQAMADRELADERVVVCIATTSTHAAIVELRRENGRSVRDTLQHISNPDFTTSSAIGRMLLDIKKYAPAKNYALVMGGHGMAWIPAVVWKKSAYSRVKHSARPLTRWIGGLDSMYQIDIPILADGIKSAGMTMDFILFDDCYMSSVEVAYDLREVTHYVIACPTEIMAFGFPYQLCGRYLFCEPDFQKLCSSFYDFYSAYEMPCGTVAVTDCTELDRLAAVVRSIHEVAGPIIDEEGEVQQMDGYSPPLFYDLEDTYLHACADSTLLASLHDQLERTVVAKSCTNYYFSATSGALYKIRHFSGINTSEPSANSIVESKTTTAWYRATH